MQLRDLLTQSGNRRFERDTAGSSSIFHAPDRLEEFKSQLREQLAQDAQLKDIAVNIRRNAPDSYNPGSNTLTLGSVNPDVLSHELGHAKNLRKASLYRALYALGSTLEGINQTVALPAALAVRAFIKDKDKRDEALNAMSSLSAALAGPRMSEELSASIDAVVNSQSKLKALANLVPAFMTHALSATVPSVTYQAAKYI